MLRIVTYNIHSGRDFLLRNRLTEITETLRSLDPDVIALQEVHENSRFGFQLTYIASQLQMEAAFIPAKRYRQGGYGSAVLSKLPITATASLPLQARREPRHLLQTTIQGSQQPFHCWVVHLSLDSKSRLAQMLEISQQAELHSRSPLLLLGDFNTASPLISPCLHDCALGTGWEKRSTLVNLYRRVDFIFATSHWKVLDYKLIPVKWSDHFPIIVTLELSPPPTPS